MKECDYRFLENGDILVSGIDFGYANGYGLKVIKKNSHIILARVKGQGSRFSLGGFGYTQPHYIFFRIVGDIVDWKTEEEIEYSKEDMKEAKLKALKRFDEITEECSQNVHKANKEEEHEQ